ncbi:hypothetical protein OC861_000953 [Tilletia horrida]|nr:hypothetical protein OC861_000953 [Tilletia horrida]
MSLLRNVSLTAASSTLSACRLAGPGLKRNCALRAFSTQAAVPLATSFRAPPTCSRAAAIDLSRFRAAREASAPTIGTNTHLSFRRHFGSTTRKRQQREDATRSTSQKVEDAIREGAAAKVKKALTSPEQSSITNPALSSSSGAASTKPKLSENIYTLPNLLTMSRLLTCPIIGWQVLEGNMKTATALLFFSAITDLLDGYLARRMNSYTVFGSIADPAADKALMTVMVVTLGIKGLIPPLLATLIIGRDVGLVLAAFYIRYASLPPPKTLARYWDFSLPSASVQPTQISKYNTFLQLCLVGVSTVMPILSPETQELCAPALTAFQWLVAGTTVWSGASYIFGKGAVTYITRK